MDEKVLEGLELKFEALISQIGFLTEENQQLKCQVAELEKNQTQARQTLSSVLKRLEKMQEES